MGERLRDRLGRLDRGCGDDHVSRYLIEKARWRDGWGPVYVTGLLYLGMCTAYVVVRTL